MFGWFDVSLVSAACELLVCSFSAYLWARCPSLWIWAPLASLSSQTPQNLCHPLPLGPGQAAPHSLGCRVTLSPATLGPWQISWLKGAKRCSRCKLDPLSCCALHISEVGCRGRCPPAPGDGVLPPQVPVEQGRSWGCALQSGLRVPQSHRPASAPALY